MAGLETCSTLRDFVRRQRLSYHVVLPSSVAALATVRSAAVPYLALTRELAQKSFSSTFLRLCRESLRLDGSLS
jgi:hypothetical protein